MALIREAGRDHEVEVRRPLRIPGRVLRPEPSGHPGRDAVRLQLGAGLVGHVAQIGGGERRARRNAGVGGLAGRSRDLDPVERAAGQPRALGRVPARLLLADVDVHLAEGVRVVGADDHRRAAGAGICDGVLPRELAERGQLPADPAFGMRERAALVADFLAVQEERAVVAEARPPVVDRRPRGEVGRAEAAERDALRRRVVRARGRVPGRDSADQVASRSNAQAVLRDHPFRDERTRGAMVACGAQRVGDLVVRQQCERAGPALVSAEAVRDPDHPIPVDGVADREDRLRDHARS